MKNPQEAMLAGRGGIAQPSNDGPRKLELVASSHFADWLAEHKVSLVFATYGASQLIMIGLEENGRLSVVELPMTRCMSVALHGDSLWVGSLYQVTHFRAINDLVGYVRGFDRTYAPRTAYVTGDLDVHDMAVDGSGRLLFVNTLFSCLATVSDTDSFRPVWKPPFVTKLAPEDRCHLNGLALKDGCPAWVTLIARSDTAEGWRKQRIGGGCMIDLASDEVAVHGLSMPHSPRWYRGKLWLNQLGTGEFGFVDLARGRFEPVCFCPGYLRGLDFVGEFAVVGLSLPRDGRTFQGLPVEDKFGGAGKEPRCAIQMIDLRSGTCVHELRIEGVVKELYDVVAMPGIRQPRIAQLNGSELRRVVSVGNWARLKAN